MIVGAVVLTGVIATVFLYVFWRVRWGRPISRLPHVLVYHKVTHFELGGTWVSPARFERQIDSLLEAGFGFIGEEAFLERLDGKRKLGGREILLTFDDGYDNFSSMAVPILERRRIPALIFLVTSFVGKENVWELPIPGRKFMHMDWDVVKDLAGRGFSFGSHTCSHRDLTRLGIEDLRRELSISKEAIESGIGLQAKSLSFPFGRTNRVVSREASDAGYSAAFTLYPRGRASNLSPYELRREGVWVIDTPFTIKTRLLGGRLFWLEDLKGRAINATAGLVPVFKRERVPRAGINSS